MSRLDIYLTENGLARSRERAKTLIKGGKVTVNGKTCTKPAQEIGESDSVESQPDDLVFVGRGGLKLEKAFEAFEISVNGAVCADIGASTGGFTQCLLEHGAKKVYAIDVGHGQLDKILASDSRVVNCEGVNARELKPGDFEQIPEFISVDVSFISLGLIIPALSSVIARDGEMVTLIKPQFEAGKKALNKKGIVKDLKDHVRVLENVVSAFNSAGLSVKGLTVSSITGGDGNIEYLAHLCKDTGCVRNVQIDIDKIVKNAFLQFK